MLVVAVGVTVAAAIRYYRRPRRRALTKPSISTDSPLLTDDVLEQIEGVLGNKPEPSGTSTMVMVSGRRGGLEEGTHWLTPKL